MTQSPVLTLTEGSRRRMVAGALAVALVTPTPSSAFFQQTKLEGPVGTDLGGVWLSIQHLMPEFRISYKKPAAGPAVPVEVGPVPPEMEPVTGKKSVGVVITGCPDNSFCSENGLLVGDMVIAINSNPIADVAAFEKALANPAPTVLLSIRRPALKMSTARLLKIRYATGQKEAEGTSIAQEELDVRLLDLALPFADAIEKSRKTHELFEPSAADMESLGAKWFELLPSRPIVFVNGKHRFVAKSAFDEALASDKSLADSKYALIMDLGGNPIKGGGGQLIDVYGIESADEKTMAGNYVSVTMANAPFPISIEFKGRFHMTKIAEWSDKDDKAHAAREAAKPPAEDLSKFKTLPDVPPPADPATKPD